MNQDEVMGVFEMLSLSQGLYGRILREVDRLNEGEKEEFLKMFEGCKTPLDVILLVEE